MVREAKDFLKSQIKQGKLTVDELADKNSVFNKILRLLKNNNGYVGYFTRAHYKKPKTVTYERLESFFKNLQTLRKYKEPIDISKHSKTAYEDLEALLQYQVDLKEGTLLPGLVVHKDPRFIELQKKLNPYDWYTIVCINEDKKNEKPQPDIEVLRTWGCPKWCIKRKSYFYNTYIKSEDHLQYILIQKGFFQKVERAAQAGKDSKERLVPHNYNGNWDSADSYPHHGESTTNLRFGINTKPSENLSFFTQRDNLSAFNDNNSGVSGIDRFATLTSGFPLRLLDIEVRKTLKLKRSEFDVSVPGFSEIIEHIGLRENEREAEVIANACGKFVQIMDKLYSKLDDFDKIRKEIAVYFENDKHTHLLDLMLYALLYADKLSPKLVEYARDMYIDDDKSKKVNMVVTISLIQIYLENHRKGISVDPQLVEHIHTNVIKGFVMYHLLRSWIRDRPKSTIDLKRAIIIVFKTGNLYNEIEGPGSQVTRSKLFKLIANYLYTHDQEYGKQVLKEQGWDDEIEFIHQIMDKKKRKDTSNSEFLRTVARNLLNVLPDVLSDKVDDRRVTPSYTEVFDELKMYNDDSIEYSYINHVEALFTSISYYITKIESSIVKEYKG